MTEPLGELAQVGAVRLAVSWRMNPGVAGDHEMIAAPDPAGVITSVGEPMTCTGAGNVQKPPRRANWPLVSGALASGWPMVPLRAKVPPALVLPPPAILNQPMEKDWAGAVKAAATKSGSARRSRQFCGRNRPPLDALGLCIV